MKWTNNATKALYQKMEASLNGYSNTYLINAVNATYEQIGVDLMTTDVIRLTSRRTLILLVMDLMIDTDYYDADVLSYYIDPQGKNKVYVSS